MDDVRTAPGHWRMSKVEFKNKQFLNLFKGQGKCTDSSSKLLLIGLMKQLELINPKAEQEYVFYSSAFQR